MTKHETNGSGHKKAVDSHVRPAGKGQHKQEKTPLDPCDSAHVAETYRLEKADEACDDGIK